MFGFKVICWALLFIFKLRFPPGVSIATITQTLGICLKKFNINLFQVSPMFSLNVSSMDYVCIVATKAVLAGGHL
jgi:hypothetical protein